LVVWLNELLTANQRYQPLVLITDRVRETGAVSMVVFVMFVSTQSFEPTDFLTWIFFASVRVVTSARRRFKLKVMQCSTSEASGDGRVQHVWAW